MHPLYLFKFCKSKIVLNFCIEHSNITGRNFTSIGQLEINFEQKRFRDPIFEVLTIQATMPITKKNKKKTAK